MKLSRNTSGADISVPLHLLLWSIWTLPLNCKGAGNILEVVRLKVLAHCEIIFNYIHAHIWYSWVWRIRCAQRVLKQASSCIDCQCSQHQSKLERTVSNDFVLPVGKKWPAMAGLAMPVPAPLNYNSVHNCRQGSNYWWMMVVESSLRSA